GDTTRSIGLWWSALTQRFRFGLPGSAFIDSTDTFAAGQFYYVAATYDGATFKLFVNGILEAQQALVTTISYSSLAPWTIGSSDANYRSIAPRTWNGVIDDVAIANRAFSGTEIQAIYAAGSAGKGVGNSGSGIVVTGGAGGNTIGGTTAAARNIIGGNAGNG